MYKCSNSEAKSLHSRDYITWQALKMFSFGIKRCLYILHISGSLALSKSMVRNMYQYRLSCNRNRGDRFYTHPRIANITISTTTRSDSADIGRFKSVMHDIGRYIRVNSELTQIFFKLCLFLVFSNFSNFLKIFGNFHVL